jgi:alkaline phosphatase D
LTGDIHTAWANDLKADWEDPSSQTIATEYVTTSITAGGTTPSDFGSAYKDAFPYIKYFDGRHGGYTSVEVSAETWKSDFYVVENMEDYVSPVTHAATWVTEAGNPGAQEG